MAGLITKTKFFVRNILCNAVTGSAISTLYRHGVPDIRWKGYRFHLPAGHVSKKNVAAVFWGFYESAEIRLIKKYFDGNSDVIELGSSVGVVSTHIASAMKEKRKLVCVEANPSLVPSIRHNIMAYAPADLTYEVLNVAIDYQQPEVQLWITGNNTETRVLQATQNENGVTVKTLKVADIAQLYKLENFTMISDIEGAEIQYLVEDSIALAECKNLFIELHDTRYKQKDFSVNDLIKVIKDDHGFTLIEQQGPVCYFSRQPLRPH